MALAVAVSLACVPATWAQVAYWRNSETLFRHAPAVTSGNYLAEHNLGNHLMDVPGRLPEAIAHLEASLWIYPQSAKAMPTLTMLPMTFAEISMTAMLRNCMARRINA